VRTVITDVRLWDGRADAALPGAAVLIEDGCIAWVGPRADAPLRSADGEIVDGRGGTLLPGLIDAHIHLQLAAGAAGDPLAGALANAAAALGVGLTAVRDLGARDHSVIAAARAIAAGTAPGPWIVAAGRPLAWPGGYVAGVAVEVTDPAGVRAAVQAQVAAGAGVIKVIASPVPAAPGLELPRSFGPENLRAAVEAAHAAGLRLTAHAHSLAGARDAVLAGFDCIEHGYRLDAATIAEMARRRVWLVPTLVAMEAAQRPWLSGARGGPADPDVRRARDRWEAAAHAAREAHRAGVRMATGTDAVTIVPVDAIRREVALLVEAAGFTPVAALRAATADAAELLGVAGVTGTIAVGCRADLLLVDGDPLADPAVLARVRGVWRAGVRAA
jgi:imidazolonepropionase-like amidohydrolase